MEQCCRCALWHPNSYSSCGSIFYREFINISVTIKLWAQINRFGNEWNMNIIFYSYQSDNAAGCDICVKHERTDLMRWNFVVFIQTSINNSPGVESSRGISYQAKLLFPHTHTSIRMKSERESALACNNINLVFQSNKTGARVPKKDANTELPSRKSI